MPSSDDHRNLITGEYTRHPHTAPEPEITRDLSPELPNAVDPRGCGCADCQAGSSVPLDEANRNALDDILYGSQVVNRSGLSVQQIRDYIWSECGDE